MYDLVAIRNKRTPPPYTYAKSLEWSIRHNGSHVARVHSRVHQFTVHHYANRKRQNLEARGLTMVRTTGLEVYNALVEGEARSIFSSSTWFWPRTTNPVNQAIKIAEAAPSASEEL